MSSLLFLGFLLLLFSHLNLRDRVKRLEWERSEHTHATTTTTPATPPVSATPVMPLVRPVPVPATDLLRPASTAAPVPSAPRPQFTPERAVTPSPSFFAPLVAWFREHTLIKLGGIFFFLGAAWFVSYAIKAGWLSPELRVAFGFLLALSSYALAYLRRSHSMTEYHVLTALGTGITAASVLAAHVVFGLLPASLSLAILAVAVAYTVFVAFPTRTLWLTMVAAVLGLIAPYMTGTAESEAIVFPYLFVLTVGLLGIGLRVSWRSLSLLLLCGVSVYELGHLGSAAPLFLFTFVCLFALVFFLSSTAALMRFNEPRTIDVTTLILTSLSYIYFTAELRTEPALSIFVGTFLVAGVGYLLLSRRYSARVVALYLGIATAGVLVGTSFLFSGFTLALAYIIEVTIAFFLVTHLSLPERVVLLAAGLYLLPFLTSLTSLTSPAWQSGAWHGDALVVYAMLASLLATTLWIVHKPGLGMYHSSQTLAAVFGLVSGAYAYAAVAVIIAALFSALTAPVMTYLVWALISVCTLYYALKQDLPLAVAKVATVSLTFPILASTVSLTDPVWSTGIYHVHGLGVLGMVIVLLLTTLLLTQQFCREFDHDLRSFIGAGVIATTLYIAAIFTTIFDQQLPPALGLIATYVSYGLLIYLLVTILVLARAQLAWIKRALLALGVPLLLSLSSFTLTGWPAGPLAPEAVGLFALIAICLLLALGVRQRALYLAGEAGVVALRPFIKALLIIALTYTVGLVWSIAHSAIAPAEAISLSLFIYTVAGLGAYVYGKRRHHVDLTYAGIALLSLVVLRLLLIDAWNMELIWRVVTFIGIGSLFILVSFFERR